MTIVDFIDTHFSLFIAVLFMVGLLVGSLLNVIIHHLPALLKQQWRQECLAFLSEKAEQISGEHAYNLFIRSHCSQCKKLITWWQNIPLVSFILLKGRCHHCRARIRWRYPFIELGTAILSAFIGSKFFATSACIAALLFSWSMIALIFIDIDEQLLPDTLTLPLLWLGLLCNVWGLFASATDAIIGAIVGYLFFWLIAKLYLLFTQREGMGQGDFKLLAAIGAWLGWQALPFVILIAASSGVLIGGIYLLIKRKHQHTPLPFGPYLAIAGWIVMIGGADWYYTWLNTFKTF